MQVKDELKPQRCLYHHSFPNQTITYLLLRMSVGSKSKLIESQNLSGQPAQRSYYDHYSKTPLHFLDQVRGGESQGGLAPPPPPPHNPTTLCYKRMENERSNSYALHITLSVALQSILWSPPPQNPGSATAVSWPGLLRTACLPHQHAYLPGVNSVPGECF